MYNGVLNRTLIKNLTVTFNASDHKDRYQKTSIPIIVSDDFNIYPISNGSKTIKAIYVNNYQNSLRNIDLGSIYVHDLNDWYRTDRTYSIRNVSNEQIFNVSNGILTTSQPLNPGIYTVDVDVTKPNIKSSAYSRIQLEVDTVDSEYVRQASTVRIQGKNNFLTYKGWLYFLLLQVNTLKR